MIGVRLAEAGYLPDVMARWGIRRMLRTRIREVCPPDPTARESATTAFYEACRRGPIALVPEIANQQHYEVAPAFFQRVLGRHLKYSAGHWGENGEVKDLDAAEEAMLALSTERAEIEDGMRVLDLGCGWGSLSLWIAERFPGARVLSVSNSKLQREFILRRSRDRRLENLDVVTSDINTFTPGSRFDRVVSVEMFEHLRNHALLLSRIAEWLAPGGKLFVHHFSHRVAAYPYEDRGEDDWMARTFFSGGMMPSHDLLRRHQDHLRVEKDWVVNGLHYHRTCEAWLRRQDSQRDALMPILADVYGREAAPLWFQRWRLFFLACSELFRYRQGREWWVTHVRMRCGTDR